MDTGRALVGYVTVWAAVLMLPLASFAVPVPVAHITVAGLALAAAVAVLIVVDTHRRIPTSLWRSEIRPARPPTVEFVAPRPTHPDNAGRPRPRAPTSSPSIT